MHVLIWHNYTYMITLQRSTHAVSRLISSLALNGNGLEKIQVQLELVLMGQVILTTSKVLLITCMLLYIGITSRSCNAQGNWHVPDVRRCNSTVYQNLFERICNVSLIAALAITIAYDFHFSVLCYVDNCKDH